LAGLRHPLRESERLQSVCCGRSTGLSRAPLIAFSEVRERPPLCDTRRRNAADCARMFAVVWPLCHSANSQPLERSVASRALTNAHSAPETAAARGDKRPFNAATLSGHRALRIPDVQRTDRAALNERSTPMLKTAWLSLDHLVCAAVGYPVLSGVAIFADLYRRLNRAPVAEMAYRKALSMSQQEPERRYLTRRLAELQKQYRALSKSGFAKRLRV
jgi:hypothetical protein